MTRGQFLALAIIGGIAVAAFIQANIVAQALRRSTFNGSTSGSFSA